MQRTVTWSHPPVTENHAHVPAIVPIHTKQDGVCASPLFITLSVVYSQMAEQLRQVFAHCKSEGECANRPPPLLLAPASCESPPLSPLQQTRLACVPCVCGGVISMCHARGRIGDWCVRSSPLEHCFRFLPFLLGFERVALRLFMCGCVQSVFYFFAIDHSGQS